jgi:hypothetical protein
MLATVLALGCYCIGWWVRWGVVGGYGLLGQLRPSDGCNWGLGSGSLGSQGPREASRTRALAPGKQIDRGEQKGHSQNLYNLWNKFLTGRIEETSTVERYILLSIRAQHVKNVHSPKFNKEICSLGSWLKTGLTNGKCAIWVLELHVLKNHRSSVCLFCLFTLSFLRHSHPKITSFRLTLKTLES